MARHGTGTRLTKQWGFISNGVNAFTADATAIGGTLAFTEAQTILRMIGEYTIVATTAPVAFDAVEITVGIGIVSTDAATLGGTAMPDPGSEPEFPWLFWKAHQMRWNSMTVQDTDGSGYYRGQFDIRSMRKVKPRESLVWVFQYVDQGGTPPVNVSNVKTRVLVGIH